MNDPKYLECLSDMLSSAPGYRTITVRNYLAKLESLYGKDFDPHRAVRELIETLNTLESELKRNGV